MTVGNGNTVALCAFSDGGVFYGYSKGYDNTGAAGGRAHACGEVVFNTAISGYQEVLTDPSYCGQIINFTYPHIGNVGVNGLDEESAGVFAAGIVARKISEHYSNWRASESLPAYLRRRRVIAIDGVDTRAITRRLRDHGALAACLMVPATNEPAEVAAAQAQALELARAADESGGMSGQMLAAAVSRGQASEHAQGEWRQENNDYAAQPQLGETRRRVTVLDCGVKLNILRALAERGCAVTTLPYESDYAAIKETQPDGVMFSNGPGDPEPCENAITLARALLADSLPLFGLCLGHQIIAVALGARTEKMKFGHHGANHPVFDEDTGRVLITSQNHGFAVRADSLPANARVTHRSLFDQSLQGIACDTPPVLTFQGHPEASPGPKDAATLFDRFIQLIDANMNNANTAGKN